MKIELPIPTSTNRLYRNGRNGVERFPTHEYLQWQEDAAKMLLFVPLEAFSVPVSIRLTIEGGTGVTGQEFPQYRDLDNCWKAVLDFLKKQGIIAGDTVRWVPEHTAKYTPPTKRKQPARCWVEITEISGENR